jgi:hypothetical protein
VLSVNLEEVVLLGVDFEMWPDGSDLGSEVGTNEPYPDDDSLRLQVTSNRLTDEIFLFVSAELTDERLPFSLTLRMAARFAAPDESVAPADVEPTLLWIVHPYIRETIDNLTSRSPVHAFKLAPLQEPPERRGDTA